MPPRRRGPAQRLEVANEQLVVVLGRVGRRKRRAGREERSESKTRESAHLNLSVLALKAARNLTGVPPRVKEKVH